MTDLSRLYMPITSDPFERNDNYTELLPSPALRPYIRCFWGTQKPVGHSYSRLVIPDTCMDIIIRFTESTAVTAFCPIDESSGYSSECSFDDSCSIFAVRFFPWSAAMFAEISDITAAEKPEEIFPKLTRMLTETVLREKDIYARVKAAERLLMALICPEKADNDVMNALYLSIISNGNVRVTDIAGYTAVSLRSLQRKFAVSAGKSPKVLTDLIRYQLLWQETALGNGISVSDAVEKFGYFDQAHMLNDFRKRHLMTPSEAIKRLSRP